MEGKVQTKIVDKPEILVILLTIALTILFILSRKAKL